MDIVITTQVTPAFTQLGPLCQNSTAPTLPLTSTNGINGTWSPSTINTSTVGTTTYTFTPNNGECAVAVNMNVTVKGISISTTNITICSNQLPYAWNGNNYNSAGTYNITLVNIAGCDSIATLILRVTQVTTSTTRDSTCVNQPYVWNGNTYTASGTYNVTLVNAAGCDSIATLILVVKPIPALVINQPPPVCEPLTINLTAPSITAGSDPGLIYTYWRDSLATIPLINPAAISASGTYYIKAQGTNNCASTKPVAVTVLIYKLIAGIRYQTVTTSPNTPTQLSARNIGNNYTWSPPTGLNTPFTKDPVFDYDRQTEYLVNITRENGCITVDTILVKIIALPGPIIKSDLFVPKAWTPNNDGHNDKLFPLTVNIRELKYFRVFNRWGQLVFETNVIGQGWDGVFQGKPAVMDVYTWTVEAIGVDGKYIKKAGNSVLIR
jgi:gliding motility-associated-like protein